MGFFEEMFLNILKDTIDTELKEKYPEGEENCMSNEEYRKLPYIKVNKHNNVEHKTTLKSKQEESKVWRVRNENIDKIDLPVFCSFDMDDGRPRRLGMLVNNGFRGNPELEEYPGIDLFEVDKQTGLTVGDRIDGINGEKGGVARLIEMYAINIGKVEIDYYE